MRRRGKHKDKKSKAEKRQAASAKTSEQKFTDEEKGDRGPAIRECDEGATILMVEETRGYRVTRNTGCNASKRNFMKSQDWTRVK